MYKASFLDTNLPSFTDSPPPHTNDPILQVIAARWTHTLSIDVSFIAAWWVVVSLLFIINGNQSVTITEGGVSRGSGEKPRL